MEVPQLLCNQIRVFLHAGTKGNSRDMTESSSQIRLTKVADSLTLTTHDCGTLQTSERQRMSVHSLTEDGKTPSGEEGFLTYY